MTASSHDRIPLWAWAAPLCAALLLAAKFTGIIPADSALLIGAATVLLGGSVFASVHHAEVLALRVGEPLGSILLAIAVTTIEVAVIVSIMLSGAEGSEEVARDTVFSAVILVLNGIVGLCLVLGGTRHFEQRFQIQGASAALAVLGTLATLTLVLPNYTTSSFGPQYSPLQLVFVGAVSLLLYCVFVFVQTFRHRAYFLEEGSEDHAATKATHVVPSAKTVTASAALLAVSLVTVVMIAKFLAHLLDHVVELAGLPQAVVGIVIACVVLMPEGIAAVKAAYRNHLQSGINLALGSALASIGLTIPVVAIASLIGGGRLTLGLTSANQLLLLLTLFVSTITLGTGRTTILQGAVHLVICAVFLLVATAP